MYHPGIVQQQQRSALALLESAGVAPVGSVHARFAAADATALIENDREEVDILPMRGLDVQMSTVGADAISRRGRPQPRGYGAASSGSIIHRTRVTLPRGGAGPYEATPSGNRYLSAGANGASRCAANAIRNCRHSREATGNVDRGTASIRVYAKRPQDQNQL